MTVVFEVVLGHFEFRLLSGAMNANRADLARDGLERSHRVRLDRVGLLQGLLAVRIDGG